MESKRKQIKPGVAAYIRQQQNRIARAGYVSYRYGSAKPVTLPRVFAGERRRNMVDKVLDLLREWRFSPFENEGPTVAGLRSGLCHDGHEFPMADNEARELVAEALHMMGAKRPNWSQGQPEYVIAAENCKYCGGELDRNDFINGRKFCSTDCARRFLRIRDDAGGVRASEITLHAWYVASIEKIPERACDGCGKMFRPAKPETRACSRECAGRIRKDAKPESECLNCGRHFRGERGARFCSVRCVNEHNRRTLPRRPCEHCGKPFQPAKPFARFCSIECGKRSLYLRQRETLPERQCADCGTMFQQKRPGQIYCSRGCASRATKRAKREAKAA